MAKVKKIKENKSGTFPFTFSYQLAKVCQDCKAAVCNQKPGAKTKRNAKRESKKYELRQRHIPPVSSVNTSGH